MSLLKDTDIKNMKDRDSKVESLGRGNGAMVFRKTGGINACYYRYWRKKLPVLIKLDVYRQTDRSPGKGLAELRSEALAMVALRKQVMPADLKEHLQNQKAIQVREQKAERRKRELENRIGTFENLLRLYAKSLKERKASSAKGALTTIENYIIKPFPELAAEKACKVTSDDLRMVLYPFVRDDKPAMYNYVRACLSASFNYGIQVDFDLRHDAINGKRFSIEYNPVSRFPKEPTRARKRELTHKELKQLWHDIDAGVFGLNSQHGLFIQFCLACFGNRPIQLSRMTWADVDIKSRCLTFVDHKKRGGPQTTVIPLTERAADILNRMTERPQLYGYGCLGDMVRPDMPVFTSMVGQGLINIDEVGNKVRDYTRAIEEQRWWLKDFRRTAVSIMTKARIIKEHRYLLQSRTDGSIEAKHYDVSDRMDEKREAAQKYDEVLNAILYGNEPAPGYGGSRVLEDRIATVETHQLNFVDRDTPQLTDDYPTFRQRILHTRELKCKEAYVREGYSNRKMRRWFNRLVDDNVIEKVGRRYALKPASEFKDSFSLIASKRLISGYETFKQYVISSGELKSQAAYIADGYSDRKINLWFGQLKSEGIIVKVGQNHFLKEGSGSRVHAHIARKQGLAESYEGFKQAIDSGELFTKKEYGKQGYGRKQVDRWFGQLQADGLIEKVGQRWQLTDTL